ncbi:hypothetical protein [Mesorhizobium sp. SP-1A]|uniref:hypothetical protein n=1 Tax=Mesorhizobium sp. SP-1A TaxID=3077840 RepID=UPI0028F71351|nr:hypothetical protein [Mesorhizobium sp. SP-1A]
MTKIVAVALASFFTTAAVVPAFAENTIIFRYNSQGGTGSQKPDAGGGPGEPRFIDLVPVFSGSGMQSADQDYVKVYGNGQFAGQGLMRFVVTGFKSEPSVSTNVPSSYAATMPLPAGSLPGVDGDAYYYMHMVDFHYGEGQKTGSITFKGDGKELTRTFNIGRRDFNHEPLSINTASWPSLVDVTASPDLMFESNRLIVRGGVPPYQATLTVSGQAFSNDPGLMEPLSSQGLTEIMNYAADRGANFAIPNLPMTEVNATIRPIIAANNCSGEDGTIANTRISMTIQDSVGATVNSPVQTIRYTPDGPHCIRFWGLPRTSE